MNIKNDVKSMLEQISLSNKKQESKEIKTNRIEFMNMIWNTLRIKSIEQVNNFLFEIQVQLIF